MESPKSQASEVDQSEARVARALSALVDDFHRQGGHLRQSQVDRIIDKRRLTPDESVSLHRLLSQEGIEVAPIAASAVAHKAISQGEKKKASRFTAQPNVNKLLADPRCSTFLTEEEEIELGRATKLAKNMAQAIEAGQSHPSSEAKAVLERGRMARERMIVSNVRLVAQHAFSYARYSGLSADDLLQDGLMGLMRAVEGFDHTAGFRFSTYATWWIRQSITRAMDDTGPLVRVPVHCAEAIRKLKKAQKRIERLHNGKHANLKQLSDELNWAPERIRFLQQVSSLHPVSFDHGPFDNEDESQWSILPDHAPGPADVIEDLDTNRHIEAVLSQLPLRTAEILRRRFGLDGRPPMTLEELGQVYGLTRERIRQIEAKALKRLAERKLDQPNLHDLLEDSRLNTESSEAE